MVKNARQNNFNVAKNLLRTLMEENVSQSGGSAITTETVKTERTKLIVVSD
jgi:hypothetical protein